LLTIDAPAPERLDADGIPVDRFELSVANDASGALRERYLGDAASAVYLIRPDQHIAARWEHYDKKALRAAMRKATGRE
jgi:3-(3-hydroxy-phenyl)propionate hydroxylase